MTAIRLEDRCVTLGCRRARATSPEGRCRYDRCEECLARLLHGAFGPQPGAPVIDLASVVRLRAPLGARVSGASPRSNDPGSLPAATATAGSTAG